MQVLAFLQTPIVHFVANRTYPKTVRSTLWHCPNTTVALRLFVNVVRVMNQEAVKIEFRHLPFLLLLSSDSLAPEREQFPGQNTHE